jgi:SNF2 family DNA or RNA helicase
MARGKVVKYYNKHFKGSLTDQQCQVLEQLETASEVSDLRHIVYTLSEDAIDQVIDSYKQTGMPPVNVEKPIGTLKDFQTVGVAFGYWSKRFILGDAMGMGKTAQAIAISNYITQVTKKKSLMLIFTEKNLVEQVRRDVIKFSGEYCEVMYGEARDVTKFIKNHPDGIEHSLVVPHSVFKQSKFFAWIMEMEKFPFDIEVVDESSVLGNSTSAISKSAKEWLKYCDRAIFLNATPFETSLETFYNQLNLLDPSFLPTKTDVEKRYYVTYFNGFYKEKTGKYKNADEFKQYVGFRYLARTRESEGATIKDCTAKLLVSPLSAEQKRIMSKVTNWRLVCDCPSYYNKDYREDNIVCTVENTPKLADLQKILREIKALENKVLIYAPYVESHKLIEEFTLEWGYSVDKLTGSTKQKDRNDIIRSFQKGEFDILITDVQKGLNFGNCDYCVFYSFNPNPMKMSQMEGRITREFDIVGKHIYLLASEGKEYNYLKNIVSTRAISGKRFTEIDSNCILGLLTGDLE